MGGKVINPIYYILLFIQGNNLPYAMFYVVDNHVKITDDKQREALADATWGHMVGSSFMYVARNPVESIYQMQFWSWPVWWSIIWSAVMSTIIWDQYLLLNHVHVIDTRI